MCVIDRITLKSKKGGRWLSFFHGICALLLIITLLPQTVWAEQNVVAVDASTPVETDQLQGWPKGPQLSCETACLYDVNSGAVLYNKGMNEKRYPASITKIMTALVALDNSKLSDVVTFTETGVKECYSGSSNLNTKVGEQFTMEQCLYALLMKSANDFATQIAEYVGGSVPNFVQMMNDKAVQLGCQNTFFSNAHGMPDENHFTSAYDIALISKEAIKNETFCKIVSTQSYTLPSTSISPSRALSSHNALVMQTDWSYEGCFGGKTGYTDAAGNTFACWATRDDRTLIAVTLRAPTVGNVFTDAVNLLDYGFENFEDTRMTDASSTLEGGWITLPSGADQTEVEEVLGNEETTDWGDMVSLEYKLGEYQVGTAKITKEAYEEALIAETTPSPTPSPIPPPSPTSVSEMERIRNLPLEQRIFTVPYLIIEGLSLLIIMGILAILFTAISKALKKKKR